MGFVVVAFLLLVAFHFAARENTRYFAALRAAEETSLATRPDPREEPAYQYPGVPAGWSLDRYARDGLQQIQIRLIQEARRRDISESG